MPLKAQNIEVAVQGIRSPKGQIVIGIYKNDESFRKDDPCIKKRFEKTTIQDGEMIVRFNLKPGTYGFSLLDDENNDDDMNYSVIGIPKEGFGFSNYYHTNLKRPKFDQFKFVLNEDQKQKIIIEIKYMKNDN